MREVEALQKKEAALRKIEKEADGPLKNSYPTDQQLLHLLQAIFSKESVYRVCDDIKVFQAALNILKCEGLR